MSDLSRRRLRAPTADGEALIDPPLMDARQLISQNKNRLAKFDRLAGFPASYRQEARQQALLSAAGRNGDKPSFAGNPLGPLILSGHQPELCHPGVWLKNFVLSSIAKATDGAGINIVIDNDVVRTPGIQVPTGDSRAPQVATVLYDTPTEVVPWEKRRLQELSVFKGFASEVRRVYAPFLIGKSDQRELLLDRYWDFALQELEYDQEFCRSMGYDSPTISLAGCLSEARRRLDREIGLATNDCNLSLLTTGKHFRTFASHLLSRHEELFEIHNAAVAEYRVVNQLRSRTHPVPELVREGEWFETPLWLMADNRPLRRRVFVRKAGNSWEITDRQGVVLPANSDDWPAVKPSGIVKKFKLRPRALITTMYARLVLSDLFIHGIGGAKYDELTDLIIRRFFNIEPPAYITATATFRLPIVRPNVSIDNVRASAQRLRDLRYRPESFVREARVQHDADLSRKLSALAADKCDYLAQHDLRRCSSDVFNHLDALNRAMHDLLSPVEEELRAQHAELLALARQSQLLASREFSFVLFPAEKLPARLLALSK